MFRPDTRSAGDCCSSPPVPDCASAVIAATGTVPDPDATARLLTGGGYRTLAGRLPADVLHAAYAAGLDRVFLVSAVLAATGGAAALLLLRTPVPADGQATSRGKELAARGAE